jgi:hypothetical protein
MAERALVGIAANEAMANIFLDRFRLAGLPVVAGQPLYPYPNAAAPVELWLTDAGLLDEPGVQDQIEEILHPAVADETVAEVADDGAARWRLKTWAFASATILGLALAWGYFFARSKVPQFQLLEGATQQPLTTGDEAWLKRLRMIGRRYAVVANFDEFNESSRRELARLGFEPCPRQNSMMERTVGKHQIVEAVHIWKSKTRLPQEGGQHVDGIWVFWAYKPGVGERIGEFIGRY